MSEPHGLVDLHAHLVTDRYVAEGRAAGIVEPEGMPAWPGWSREEHLAMMDANGIDRAVLSISAPGIQWAADVADLARHVNDAAAEHADARGDRFSFFASLPLLDVDATMTELDRALALPGAAGVVLETNTDGHYLGDPLFAPLLTELDRRGAVVFVHPVGPPHGAEIALGRPRPLLEFLFDTARTITDLVLTGGLQRYPRIRFVFAHAGAVLPLLVDRIELFRRFLLSGDERPTTREQVAGLWWDLAGTPVPAQLPALEGIAAADRLVFGSDYCFTPPPLVAAQVAALDAWFADEDWRGRMGANARALLG